MGSFTVDNHRQYISPYYSQIRKVAVELQQNNVLFGAHPKLSKEAPLEFSTKAATLLNLHGLHTYKGVPHFASAATVEFQALLDTFFEALVAKAGHSGRKDLDQPPPLPWNSKPENEEDRATKDKKNARKRDARARDKAAKQKGSAEKKRKRGHHEDVPFIRFPRGGSKPKRGGSKPKQQAARGKPKQQAAPGKPRWFLKSKPSCSSIMQYVGEPSKDNSWRKGL